MSLKTKWELTILGCGTSTGVPLLFCECKVCRSSNPKNHRLRTSAWLKVQTPKHAKSFLIDTSTDLRAQALAHRIPRIDAIFFTHPHADHVSGIDEIRSFNFAQNSRIPAYGNAWTTTELRARFPYIFLPADKVEGGGIPQIDLHTFESSVPEIRIDDLSFIPVALSHGNQECIGYRFDSLAYVTDCNSISEDSLQRLRGLDTLVLDCLRLTPHGTHFNLDRALEIIAELKPRQAVLTHLGHDFEYDDWSIKLPQGTRLAYDGLILSSPEKPV